MKFSLIAAIVVLALAQGSFAQDAPTVELEKLGQYLEDIRTKVVAELSEILSSQDLQSAQTIVQDKAAKLQPLVAQVQEQLKAVATNAEEQIKPLTTSIQGEAQVQFEAFQAQLQGMLNTLMEKTKALTN